MTGCIRYQSKSALATSSDSKSQVLVQRAAYWEITAACFCVLGVAGLNLSGNQLSQKLFFSSLLTLQTRNFQRTSLNG